MKYSTIGKYINLLNRIKSSGLTINEYCVEHNIRRKTISNIISKVRNSPNTEEGLELIKLYNELTNLNNSVNPIEDDNRTEIEYVRENEKIKEYVITVYVKDSVPFRATLSRDEAETLFGCYTYYGGNITARNVANEFPKYTLPEIKKIFKAFGLTKDSIWVPPHLVEEYTIEQISDYRMRLKERAAFKYADYRQERDFKNVINKLASKINKLEDDRSFIKELLDSKINFVNERVDIKHSEESSTTGIICISDLHVGAFNQTEGYLDLPEYNENEINRRLDLIIESVRNKNWNDVIVLNLGDNIDSYRRMTTSMTHELPCIYTDREIANMYLRIMMRFFNQLNYFFKPKYISIGSGNHSGAMGYLLEVTLAYQLKNEYDIEGYVSNKEIDTFDLNDVSFIYLHGRSEAPKGQKKPFPLNLDMKTQCWFNDFFADCNIKLNKRKVVLKGDLHQYSINSVSSFDYINCPSIYGSSCYIVSNYGNTPWGCAYLEIDNKGNYTSGLIRE